MRIISLSSVIESCSLLTVYLLHSLELRAAAMGALPWLLLLLLLREGERDCSSGTEVYPSHSVLFCWALG